MACKFNPELLRSNYDEAGNAPISRAGHLKFRDDLIRLLKRLQTKTINNTLVVTGLSIGTSQDVLVDHSASEEFCFSHYPEFTAVDGIEVQVFAMIDIGGVSHSTTGSKFVARISNISASGHQVTLSLLWSRTGMIA